MQLAKSIVNIILEFDGKIKYRKGKYIDIIPKNDLRYAMLSRIINKKLEIIKNMEIAGSGFYFEVHFNVPKIRKRKRGKFKKTKPKKYIGLVYDCNFSYPHKFEICYFDMTNVNNFPLQIRTYI